MLKRMVKKNPRIFMHCWLEYKLEQIFEDTVWHFLKMLNMELLYDLCVCVKLLQSCPAL